MGKAVIHRKMVKVGDRNYFIRDTEGDKPAILCLHGRWGRGETWMEFMHHYGDRYRIIAPGPQRPPGGPTGVLSPL